MKKFLLLLLFFILITAAAAGIYHVKGSDNKNFDNLKNKIMFKKLTPNLMVKDVSESVKFYTEILGFTLNMAVAKDSQKIENKVEEGKDYVYAMVSRDEVFFMLMEKKVFEADLEMLKGKEIGASLSFYIDVDNLDEIYSSIKDKIKIVKDLHTTWYGMREFYIKDTDGYILCFAQQAEK